MSFSVEVTDKQLNRRVCLRTERRSAAIGLAAALEKSGTVSSVRVWDHETNRFLEPDLIGR